MQFNDLGAQQARLKPKLDRRIADVLAHGVYIMGPEVVELEQQLSAFCAAKHVVTCANGTDALQLCLMTLEIGEGDAVFVPSFTFAATAEVAPLVGATPVLVDCDPVSFTLDPVSFERSIESAVAAGLRPACVIAVDLFGQPADYDDIGEVAQTFDMHVISDCAQGFGSTYRGQKAGRFARMSTTSFFPAKPLGCYGDGGAIFCEDDSFAEKLRSLRVHGKGTHKYANQQIGLNSRLDTLQAAILCEKLAVFGEELEKRAAIAGRYTSALAQYVNTPQLKAERSSSWAQYTITLECAEQRNRVQAALANREIPTQIYYPTPLHMQPAYCMYPSDPDGLAVSERLAQTVLSLPMHPYLQEVEQDRVIEAVKDYVT
ncbi:MAG: DegT/DnrJ/EryC1/StrS family aminotransferase [Litoreibacter sp.]|nr:DegT/DnrJ/EryC1/StrS family aminotransferase [Litoreibacter sp.]MCY4336016.1 DegT/DnrJ/EryC1/StrS family aminotransferase [Litoreibacter sp.]